MRRGPVVTAGLAAAGVLLALGHAQGQDLPASQATSPAGALRSLPAELTSTAGEASAIHWEKSLTAARSRAQRENKPILLLHMFGRLDEPFC